ncbi:MAG: hypothetical protein ACJ76P_05655 [Actinomycetota bacterium]
MIGSDAELQAIARALHAVNGPWLPGVLDREARLLRCLRDARDGLTFSELKNRIEAYRGIQSEDAWRLFRTDVWHLTHAGAKIDEISEAGEPRRYVLSRSSR